MSASSPSLFAFLRSTSGLRLSDLPQFPIPLGSESPFVISVEVDGVMLEVLRFGVKYSEKVRCNGVGTCNFFIKGADIFFLRNTVVEAFGSI